MTSATTPLRFAVLGMPVAHSRSPAMHTAAYRSLGLPHSYEKLETSEAELSSRVDALRRGDFAGLNVTVPHKTRVIALADEIDASARAAGAANTLVRTAAGAIRAHNTDTPALAGELSRLAALRTRTASAGSPPSPEPVASPSKTSASLAHDAFRGKTALVLGTGGAARAAIVALAAYLDVGRVVVRGRSLGDASQAHAFVEEMRAALATCGVSIAAAGAGTETAGANARPSIELLTGDLAAPAYEDPRLVAIVQATSCGMKGAAPGELVADAVDWDSVPDDAVALDVVYAPKMTPFLTRAAMRGLSHDHGLGMLARQGALAFELWLGLPPPFETMFDALDNG